MSLWGIIWDFFVMIVSIFAPFFLISLAAVVIFTLAKYLIGYSIARSKTKKSVKKFLRNQPKSGKRVELKDSPLFMAFLKKISDKKLTSLYVNPHMACFNFAGNIIRESEMMDFQKLGYQPIDEYSILQYMEQLAKAARRLKVVKRASFECRTLVEKPYLIFDGYYNRAPRPDSCLVLTIEYSNKIHSDRDLKSFTV